MTKADLTAVIADKLKLPWVRWEILVDQILARMIQALQRGDSTRPRLEDAAPCKA